MKKTTLFYFFMFCFILFNSCQTEDEITSKIAAENFVTAQEAGQIANAQFQNLDLTTKSSTSGQTILAVKDDFEDPTMYIINSKSGGFIIVSADNRTEPIIAFSETNNFSTDIKNAPIGISSWMQNQSEYIKEVGKKNFKQTLIMQKVWNKYKSSAVLFIDKKAKKNQEKQVLGKGRVPSYLDWISEGDCNQGDNLTTLTHHVAPLFSTS
ncbi:MAG: Spi family protease inhibitor [Flavobacterium sp.]